MALFSALSPTLKEEIDLLELQHKSTGAITRYVKLLKACSKSRSVNEGKRLHQLLLLRKNNEEDEQFVWSHVVKMYLECGSFESARNVFDSIAHWELVEWTSMIAAHARQGLCSEGFHLFRSMLQQGVLPDIIALTAALSACGERSQGKLVHRMILESGDESQVFVGTALVRMYARCNSLEEAHAVFDRIRGRDVIAWTTMLAAYGHNGELKKSIQLLESMEGEGVRPNKITFVTLLSCFSGPEALEDGALVHAKIRSYGASYESDTIVGNALVSMYRRCSDLTAARKMFWKIPKKNLISWTSMLGALVESGNHEDAFDLFGRMEIEPDRVCLTTMINACSTPDRLNRGRAFHEAVVKQGFFDASVSVGNSLVNMYGKCGSLTDAAEVFRSMKLRNIVSWTMMIGACVDNGNWKEALQTFRQSQLQGEAPNKVTFVTVLNASSSLACLSAGRLIHSCILESGFELDTIVGTALVNMYGKCGILDEARRVFERIKDKDLVSWNAMLAVNAQHGHENEALKIFHRIQQSGTKPDSVTFVSVLFACSHAGLTRDAIDHFESMVEHGLTAGLEHYGCIVDVLGRSGKLVEAEEFIRGMKVQPNAAVWRCLLSAARMQRKTDCGMRAAEEVLRLDPGNSSAHVVLSNIYAANGQWEFVARLRKAMISKGISKVPGRSWIEVKNKVHEFMVADRSHPRSEEIYEELERLYARMIEGGYVAETEMVLHDVEEEEKTSMLRYHSEKLAMAFGILTSEEKTTTLRIFKNLRVCVDCHNVSKLVSRIVKREIVVRDANRFHHFKAGVCSCGDYW